MKTRGIGIPIWEQFGNISIPSRSHEELTASCLSEAVVSSCTTPWHESKASSQGVLSAP